MVLIHEIFLSTYDILESMLDIEYTQVEKTDVALAFMEGQWRIYTSKKSKKIVTDWVPLEADSEMEIHRVTCLVTTTGGKKKERKQDWVEIGLEYSIKKGLSHSYEEVWL